MPKGNKKVTEKKEDLEKFAKELQGSDSDEDAVVIEQPTVEPTPNNQNSNSEPKSKELEPEFNFDRLKSNFSEVELSAAEKELLRTELDKVYKSMKLL